MRMQKIAPGINSERDKNNEGKEHGKPLVAETNDLP
jgi:hypothetical protein